MSREGASAAINLCACRCTRHACGWRAGGRCWWKATLTAGPLTWTVTTCRLTYVFCYNLVRLASACNFAGRGSPSSAGTGIRRECEVKRGMRQLRGDCLSVLLWCLKLARMAASHSGCFYSMETDGDEKVVEITLAKRSSTAPWVKLFENDASASSQVSLCSTRRGIFSHVDHTYRAKHCTRDMFFDTT